MSWYLLTAKLFLKAARQISTHFQRGFANTATFFVQHDNPLLPDDVTTYEAANKITVAPSPTGKS